MATSLVLPCFNPPTGWEQNVCTNYHSICSRVQEQIELVIVIDGKSTMVTNETLAFLQENIRKLKLISYPVNRGKGYAIRQGVAAATGDVIIYTDIDFPYNAESIQAIYEALNQDECDVAIGVKNETYYSHVRFFRRTISKCLRYLVSLFLSMPVTDTQCGLKGFRLNVAPLFLETTIDRYLFDLEFIRNCFKSKRYRVKAIPVILNEHVHFRSMNYRILIPEMANFIKLLLNNKNG
ncbi:MAG: glycosyltransferase family 2 protein [Chitinophagales bacterium]